MINLCSKVAGRLSSTHTAAHRWAGIGVGVQSSKRVVSTTASANRSTNMSSSEYIAAYVTVPSQELGSKIATALLTDKLVACVNIIPGVQSMYWWEGKIETDSELLLMIKSRRELLDLITAKVKEVHEYDVPEVISVPILGGNEKYLDWIKQNTQEASRHME